MAIPKFEKDISYISKLADQPNDTAGNPLSAAQLKDRFDAAGNDIKAFINDELVPAISEDIAAAAEGLSGGGQLGEEKIADGAISASKLAVAAVRTSAMANAAVTTEKMADGATVEPKIADGAVTTKKIAKGAVTYEALADESVSANKIFPGAVITQKIADGAVTAAKIANGAVSQTFTATIPASGWSMSDGWGYINIAVQGLLATDSPIIDIDMGAISGTENLLYGAEYWGNIFRATSYANSIRIYAYEAPSMDIPIKMVVIRK